MSATNTSSFVVHPVSVPTTSELRTINFYLLKKKKRLFSLMPVFRVISIGKLFYTHLKIFVTLLQIFLL